MTTTMAPAHALPLYELSMEARALDDLTAMEDGEFTPEIDALHTELMDQIVSKADAFGSYLRELEARETAIADEIARLAARKKRLASRMAWMKAYAVTALRNMDRPRIDGTLFTLAIQKNPPSVQITVLPDALPAEYVRVIPETREPDRKTILDALKAGVEIAGATLAETTYHLRVR